MDSLPKSTKEKILQNTRNSTEFYGESHQLLPKLYVREYPQLQQVDFYGGDRIPDHDHFTASSQTHRGSRNQGDFKSGGERCELSDLLHHFKQGQLTFIGPAGSGKSTLLKAIVRDVIDGNYESHIDVEIVHFIQCHNFRRGDKITLGELLFQNMNPELSDEEIEETLEYAATNPNRFLFIVDSLDTLSYTIDGVYNQLCVTDHASPEAVLWNFLTGKLVPGCRIITSSREHSIRNYNGELRAQKVIALVGLSMDSITKIIVGYVGENEAEEIIQYMKDKSPTLMDLSATPVFLTYNLVGFKCRDDFTPSTMSGILILLLNSFIRSPHAHEKHILEVINKLQELSFTGTKERRVLFSTEEFARFGLEPKAATDLAILAPGGLTQPMLLGSDLLFFAHQSIQELLTAMYIAQMPSEHFLNFLRDSIHTPPYAVVRRILCGLLLNDKVRDQAEQYFQGNLNVKENQDTLRISLQAELQRKRDSYDILELCISWSETGDKAIIDQSKISEMNFRDLPLSVSDMYAIGSVISGCHKLDSLKFVSCHLKSRQIACLERCLRDSETEVREVSVRGNRNLGQGFATLITLAQHLSISSLDLEDCNVTPEILACLADQDAIISHLNVSLNADLDDFRALGAIVKRYKVSVLKVKHCPITSDQLKQFVESVGDHKLEELYFNLPMSSQRRAEDTPFVSELFTKVSKKIDLENWKFNEEDLDELRRSYNELLKKPDVVKGRDRFFDHNRAEENRKQTLEKRESEREEKKQDTPVSNGQKMICLQVAEKIKEDKGVHRGRFISNFMGKFGAEVAVKMIPKRDLEISKREPENLLALVRHPNVVQYIHCDDGKHDGHDVLYLVMEKCSESTLSDLISKKDKLVCPLNGCCKEVIIHIAQGLRHIHGNDILHRDLKPQNILFSLDGKVVRIGDFGFSKKISLGKEATSLSSNRKGTDGWRSPETYKTKSITKKSDIFSLGLIVFHLLSGGKHPFGEKDLKWAHNISEYEDLDLDGLRVAEPEIARDLIEKMLRKSPDDRPGIEEVLEHPYFWEASEKLGFYGSVVDILDQENRIVTQMMQKKKTEQSTLKSNSHTDDAEKEDGTVDWKVDSSGYARTRQAVENIPYGGNKIRLQKWFLNCVILYDKYDMSAFEKNESRKAEERRDTEQDVVTWWQQRVEEFTSSYDTIDDHIIDGPYLKKSGSKVTGPKDDPQPLFDMNTLQFRRSDSELLKKFFEEASNYYFSHFIPVCSPEVFERLKAEVKGDSDNKTVTPLSRMEKYIERVADNLKYCRRPQDQNSLRDSFEKTYPKLMRWQDILLRESESSRQGDKHKVFCNNAQHANGNDIFTVVKYIRNKSTHFEDDKRKQGCATWQSKDEMWKFVSSVFPELFPHVYNVMKDTITLKKYVARHKKQNTAYTLPELTEPEKDDDKEQGD